MKTYEECKEEALYYGKLVEEIDTKILLYKKDLERVPKGSLAYQKIQWDIQRVEVRRSHHELTTRLWLKRAKKLLDKRRDGKCDE